MNAEPSPANPGGRRASDRAVLLRAVPLFAEVPVEQLNAAAKSLHSAPYPAGYNIIEEGEDGDACYLVVVGSVGIVSRDLTGQEVVLATLGPGSLFGEVALVTEGKRTATVRALEPVTVAVLHRSEFTALETAVPAFAKTMRSHAELLALDTFLHRASPFAHLPSEAIRRLAGQMRVRRCDAGEIVVREGDEGSRFYLVRSGRFEVVRRGRRLQILDEGDSFGEVALLTGVRRIATVRALDAAEVLSLTKAELLAVVQEHESLQRQFAEFVRIRAGEALARAVDVRVSPAVPAPPAGPRPLRLGYLKFLLAGVAVFAVLSFLASWTAAPPAIYAALAVGSFVGPVAYVLYLAESALLPEKPLPLIITFLLTAAVGIPLAMRLHEWTGAWPGSLQSGLLIGLTEETVKIFGVLWLLRRSASRFQMDGVIYGAAAGMGFAAFENLIYGYAQMGAVGTLLSTLWARTLLSPFGHGAWTAIIAAAIWRSKSDGGVRGALRIAGAFLLSVGLHGLWDWQPFDGVALHLWLAAIGLVGVEILRVIIARATRETAGAILALNPQAQSAGAPGAHSFVCGACGSESPAGTHYCVRCGAALRLARGG